MIITVKEINPEWNPYDLMIASLHLERFGEIYLDEYGCPIDNEYELDEIEKELVKWK